MNNRNLWLFVGGVAVGAVGAALLYRNREKVKPMAAELVAKAMGLKEKAMEYASRTREHAEDIVAEARHINETVAE